MGTATGNTVEKMSEAVFLFNLADLPLECSLLDHQHAMMMTLSVNRQTKCNQSHRFSSATRQATLMWCEEQGLESAVTQQTSSLV